MNSSSIIFVFVNVYFIVFVIFFILLFSMGLRFDFEYT